MIKTKTFGGSPAYGLTIQTCVTLSDFAIALCERAYNDKGLDFASLTKKMAKKVLVDRIEWYGRNPEYMGSDRGDDTQDEYNDYYSQALKWVLKNYPYYLTNLQQKIE